MAYRFVEHYHYPWPVIVRLPHPEHAGDTAEQSFEMTFRAITDDEARSLDERLATAETPRAAADMETAFLLSVCTGWNEEVLDAEGEPVPFSGETLARMLAVPFFKRAVMAAFLGSMRHEGGPRLGN